MSIVSALVYESCGRSVIALCDELTSEEFRVDDAAAAIARFRELGEEMQTSE